MSKQLSISASASVFAMAAFALFAAPISSQVASGPVPQTGATTEVAAPALDRGLPDLVNLIR